MAIFLALPDAKRLWDFFVMSRPIAPAPIRPRFRRRWLNWSITCAMAGLFMYLALQMLISNYALGEMFGLFGPQPRLQGAWDVVEFERDGQVIPPSATDSSRWSQVVIENSQYGVVIAAKPFTGAARGWLMEVAEDARRLNLTDVQEIGKPPIALTYDEPAPGDLVLAGTIDGKKLRVKLHQLQFKLTTRGFHWVNETPPNS